MFYLIVQVYSHIKLLDIDLKIVFQSSLLMYVDK